MRFASQASAVTDASRRARLQSARANRRCTAYSPGRRGVALLAALWLIVAIAAVAVQFELAARERRVLGVAASDRARERAAAAGALATVYAQLDNALRTRGTAASSGGNVGMLRATDPWLDVDSLYSGVYYVDSMPVQVVARDLGTTININTLTEDQLRLFLSYVLGDYRTADQLAQSIMDWRDTDDNPRSNGAEREQYLQANLMVLPTNAPFREVDDLAYVYGMTPEVLETIRPYITTHGSARVNLNTAPEPVLRALPGMTDAIMVQILAGRSQGRRIQSVEQITGAAFRNGSAALQETLTQQLNTRATVSTSDVELTMYVNADTKLQPTRLVAIVNRPNNTQAAIQWQQW
jgi:type II secretory pathway component PulK